MKDFGGNYLIFLLIYLAKDYIVVIEIKYIFELILVLDGFNFKVIKWFVLIFRNVCSIMYRFFMSKKLMISFLGYIVLVVFVMIDFIVFFGKGIE